MSYLLAVRPLICHKKCFTVGWEILSGSDMYRGEMTPGARNKFGAPMFGPGVFRKRMCCVEASTCDTDGIFLRPAGDSAPPVMRRLGHCAPLSPSLRPWWSPTVGSNPVVPFIFGSKCSVLYWRKYLRYCWDFSAHPQWFGAWIIVRPYPTRSTPAQGVVASEFLHRDLKDFNVSNIKSISEKQCFARVWNRCDM